MNDCKHIRRTDAYMDTWEVNDFETPLITLYRDEAHHSSCDSTPTFKRSVAHEFDKARYGVKDLENNVVVATLNGFPVE